MSCFAEYATAPVINDRVLAVYELIKARGEEAHYSSLLHVIVDDMNVDDYWLSLGEEDDRQQRYDSAEQWERDIFDGLASLSEAERATAIAMEWGYFDRTGRELVHD